ncbi:MAG: hypothetical protein OER86_12930 [Phycisphaerae bacterium]|nr:hypothetical protein [Phycisphaerae bacterium]
MRELSMLILCSYLLTAAAGFVPATWFPLGSLVCLFRGRRKAMI